MSHFAFTPSSSASVSTPSTPTTTSPSPSPSPTAAVPFPLIVSLLGADTALGQLLFSDLLHSPRVDKLHAIAFDDFPLLHTLSSSVLRKARVSITSPSKPDRLERALARISECDIALCVLTTDRKRSSYSRSAFRALNYTVPTQFIRRMFALGVLHLSVLSHIKADHDSPSDFYALKADLEKFVRGMRRQAAHYAPIISIFKMPSHVMATKVDNGSNYFMDDDGVLISATASQQQQNSNQSLIAEDNQLQSFASISSLKPSSSSINLQNVQQQGLGRSQSFRDPTTSRRHATTAAAAVPHVNSRHIQISEVSAALQIDAFYKASVKGPPGEPKRKPTLEIFDAEDVQHILDQVQHSQQNGSPYGQNTY